MDYIFLDDLMVKPLHPNNNFQNQKKIMQFEIFIEVNLDFIGTILFV